MSEFWQQVKKVRQDHRKGCLMTIIEAPPELGLTGQKYFYDFKNDLVHSSDTGPDLTAQIKEIALNAPDKTFITKITLPSQQELEVFVQPLLATPILFILGGGNIALPLAQFGKMVDFKVTVVDDRPEFANPVRFNMADEVICDNFVKVLRRTEITDGHYIVIVTRGHRHDLDCLQEVIRSDASYIGMVGSKRRVAGVRDLLLQDGVDQSYIDKLYSPIGLELGAETPEEIALSIIAQVVQRQKALLLNAQGRVGRRGELELDPNVLNTAIEVNAQGGEKCALATIVEVKGSAPRKAGAQMLCFANGRVVGSIGGGCGEAEVRRAALDVLTTGIPCLYTVDLTNDTAADEGMACGGKMKVFVQLA